LRRSWAPVRFQRSFAAAVGSLRVPMDLPVAIDIWGGIEATVNRVGQSFYSQLACSGHDDRDSDVDLIADLGIRALRYPVLWERIAPVSLDSPDWNNTDSALRRLRERDVQIIAGLLHHGSGPIYTSLVDPTFPEKLARFTGMAARRYPWIGRYTPINEPLTTARFSGLYGKWYPHARDPRVFATALLNQCQGIVLAMREIRAINSSAQLVQTEDLGETYSTPALAYQARFNNDLRWLAWDLLCGRVDRGHSLWQWLTEVCAVTDRRLAWFVENPCVPDVLGANYYVTSERFLDDCIDAYPVRYHGGNGRAKYADIEAVRSLETPTGGLGPLLVKLWQRYKIPVAVTECHMDATRDDHLRWIAENWEATIAARRAGAEIVGFTVWSLLGSFDWNSLLTERRGYYEPGAFDVRGAHPRMTAVGHLLEQLARGESPSHPVLCSPGWWRRNDRLFSRPAKAAQTPGARLPVAARKRASPLLISGATGTLGKAFGRICRRRGLPYALLSRAQLDIADESSVVSAIEKFKPWAVINASGYVRIDAAEHEVSKCLRENALGPSTLAKACSQMGLPLVVYSSDMVFDGQHEHPYVEHERLAPLNVYGKSKAEAEAQVLARCGDALIIRSSAFFGPWDQANYVSQVIKALTAGGSYRAAVDLTISPTYVPDLVNASLDLLIDGEKGIWHLTNECAVTWADLAIEVADRAHLDRANIYGCAHADLQWHATRPAYSALRSERAKLLPDLQSALDRYFLEREVV